MVVENWLSPRLNRVGAVMNHGRPWTLNSQGVATHDTFYQFYFHALCEDYHALIRRHQFDICGEKSELNKSKSAPILHSCGAGNNISAAFIEGFSAPRHILQYVRWLANE